jgi:proteic killer suppression protein
VKVKFKTSELEYFFLTPLNEIRGKLPLQKDVIKQFKKKVQILISIDSLNELTLFKSLNFEELRGDREGYYSIRLNKQYRLIFILDEEKEEQIICEIILITEISKHYEK